MSKKIKMESKRMSSIFSFEYRVIIILKIIEHVKIIFINLIESSLTFEINIHFYSNDGSSEGTFIQIDTFKVINYP